MKKRDIPPVHGLTCSCCTPQPRVAAADDDDDGINPATKNETDLRRARQRARAVVGLIGKDIKELMDGLNVTVLLDSPEGQRQVNRRITEVASTRLNDDLLTWLEDRRRAAMGRGARDALSKMAQTTTQSTLDDFRGTPDFGNEDRALNQRLRNLDSGLLFDDDDSLAEEIGNDVTRQLRQGVRNDETIEELGDRVDYIMTDGDPERRELGIAGQTKRTKGELISHDAVQDAYNTAARQRYAQNGFRYAVIDATLDTRTTDICERMNETVVDMMDDPDLLPPYHPYCRTGIRPKLNPDGRVTKPGDVADEKLQTIGQTKAYRPPVDVEQDFRPTDLTQQVGDA
jgi:SPP1 gp7 family putative phage head morphogenesis protein